MATQLQRHVPDKDGTTRVTVEEYHLLKLKLYLDVTTPAPHTQTPSIERNLNT